MAIRFSTVVYPVKDLQRSKAVYTALFGAPPQVDEPYYVGYQVGEVHVGLAPDGDEQGRPGPVTYADVDDLDAAIAALVDAGASVRREPQDVGGGTTVALVSDADGNVVGLRKVSWGG